MKTTKKTALKATPAIVASCLVKRFTIAVVNSTAEIEHHAQRNFAFADVRLPGTFHMPAAGFFVAQHQHRQRHHGEAPDHAEGVQAGQQ